ncbi:MAG: hypothetical protein JNM56_05140 [Planctomycetia bacterium]|nr:hypothetical protein [Planctomycetia bacterium]
MRAWLTCLRGVVVLAAWWTMMLAASAADADPKAQVTTVIKAVGGPDKLLKLVRIKEKLYIGADPAGKGSDRVSVLEPPNHWWLGKNQRTNEPAVYLVWAWTLGALVDPKSKIESIPEIKEGDRPAFGLRVSETITPPMDIYFDQADQRLVRIDWRSDIHRFSDWKEHDGVKYPAKCVGYKKAGGKQWYATEIVELERLKELPEGLKR